MPDSDAVAAALARLVNGTASPAAESRGLPVDSPPPQRVVAEAEAAFEALPTAAAFVANGGEQRLRQAVESPAAEPTTVDRGHAALTALDRLRDVTSEPAPASETPVSDEPAGRDHFRRGRTTLLKGDGVATDR